MSSVSRRWRTKEEVVAAHHEAEITNAAGRVIARDGYRNASMEKIANAASISMGALHLDFDSKEELAASRRDGP